MSRIDDLIQKLCPDGVEYKTLGSVAKTFSGLSGKSKADFIDGNERFVSYMNAYSNLAVNLQANDFVKIRNNEKQNILHKGDVIITGSSESLEEAGFSSVLVTEPNWPLYLNSFCFAVRFNDPDILSPGFSKYLFRSKIMRKQIRLSAAGVTRFNISKNRFMRIRVPVPPLPVQEEIVRILGSFTSLEAELEAELEARKKQYEYYRDQLLTFRPSAEREARWLTLAEMEDAQMIKLGRGKVISKRDIENNPGDYPVYSSSAAGIGEFGRYGDYLFDDERITWSIDGGGRFFYRPAERYSVTNVSGWLKVLDQAISTKFLFYELETLWTKKTFDYTKKAHPSVIRREYTIAIPPLEEQQRIVSILDKFDGLVSNLSSGLPAEIAARRQQYEFYRDRLLSFKELAA